MKVWLLNNVLIYDICSGKKIRTKQQKVYLVGEIQLKNSVALLKIISEVCRVDGIVFILLITFHFTSRLITFF